LVGFLNAFYVVAPNPYVPPIVIPPVLPAFMNVFCILKSEVYVNLPKPSLPAAVAYYPYLNGPALLESKELPLILVPYLVLVLLLIDSKSLSITYRIFSSYFSFETHLYKRFSNSF
jgi:hypothetical protein